MTDEILKIETDKSVGLMPKEWQPTAELKVNEMKMTKEAQTVADAIHQVWWDWGNMEPSHPNVIAVAALRKVVEELKYIGITEKNILELANELEELK